MPESGISQTLARERAERIGSVGYRLAVNVPEDAAAPVTGRVAVRFLLESASAQIVLDFAPAPNRSADRFVSSVETGGAPLEFHLANGHIVIPAGALEPGETTIEIGFRAGEPALTRGDALVYTLFVPDRAHAFFPCFDQPDLKAKLQLTLEVPAGWQALANGAEVRRTDTDEGSRIEFAETAPISTYLMAFAAGRFDVESANAGGRTIRMFHRERDRAAIDRNHGAALDSHAVSLDWLEHYTGIPYAFDKLDFALLPDFQFAGMEHPGAIFYRASHVLLDAVTTQAARLSRAHLIAHETAHMWFGNLVTMRWFDDVWLKEVFANFAAAKIVGLSFPAVDHDLAFFASHYPQAYDIDRTRGTHSIRQPLENLNGAADLYSAIIYRKAPIVMRQLERMLGPALFREGVREYLSRFAFGNAAWDELLAILDARTDSDLAAFGRAWIDEAGRPEIRSVVDSVESGLIGGLTLVQGGPGGDRSRRWPQTIEVVAGDVAGTESYSVDLSGTSARVAEIASLRPGFVLASGRGIAYGDVVLDETSRAFLVRNLPELGAPLLRAVGWVTLWEEMLEARIASTTILDAASRILTKEDNEQVAQLVLDRVDELVWRFLTGPERERSAPRLERVLRDALGKSASTSFKAALFSSYCRIASTRDGVAWFERLWRREASIPDLPLGESQETTITEVLALHAHGRSLDIVDAELARIADPERRARLSFLRPALSPDVSERERFFESLADPRNRRREPWVLDGLRFLNHPLRSADAVALIEPALERLVELRATGGIFFPRAWARAVLSGHSSAEAANEVDGFLDRCGSGYPAALRRLIHEASDPLFRAVALQSARLGRASETT